MDAWVIQGLDFVRWIQGLGPWLKWPALFFTILGTEEFYLLFMPFVFWCVSRAVGIDLLVLLLTSTGLNEWVKGVFKLPRPYWIEPKLALSTDTSFGLPSGHAQNALALWGYLGLILRSPWRWLAILVALLIALSRPYLGVHFPADTLTGWALGLLVLVGFHWLKPRLAPRLRRWPLRTHIIAATLTASAVMAVYWAAASFPTGRPDLYGALFAVAHAHTYEAGSTLAGMIFGAWIGLAIEERSLRFSALGPWSQRILRLVIGLVVLLALRFGLKAIFPMEPLALGLAFRAVRYALMMLWVILGWPYLFMRLGLARRE